jgi:hypothetical protein
MCKKAPKKEKKGCFADLGPLKTMHLARCTNGEGHSCEEKERLRHFEMKI